VSLIKRSLSAVGKIGIIIGIAVAFLFGLTTTVFLSLRSAQVKVPDVVGKDRLTAENALADSGLNIRVRATRPSADAKPDTILMQLPRAGEMVKEGQTVAVDLSRVPRAGEASISIASAENKSTENKPEENKEAENSNSNQPAAKNDNANANQNQNRPKKNKNANSNSKNANNSNNSNNGSNAGNSNRNANNRNANQNLTNRNTARDANNVIHNANTTNINRNNSNANSNRRAPLTTPSPLVNPGNRRTP
jgi:hypothetical protein